MSVKVNNLVKEFGTQRAVDELSFEAKPGEILGFLGPNGAGKSTTMKMITTYMEPTSGSITVCGHDSNTDTMEVRKSIGYLPEHNPLYLDMYIREYLLFVAQIHSLRNAKSRIDDLITMTGLEIEQHKKIANISKGYRQRVGLAQALIHDPEVIILDEPTSGLDMNQLVEIRKLIKSLGKEKTVIFSTHIMQEVQALCDRVVIINEGKLVADDPISMLQSRISSDSVVHLEVLGGKMEGLESISGIKSVDRLSNNTYRIVSKSDKDYRPDIYKYCVSANAVILEMRKEEKNVESIFQQLTNSQANV